jgi:hypothetical protein
MAGFSGEDSVSGRIGQSGLILGAWRTWGWMAKAAGFAVSEPARSAFTDLADLVIQRSDASRIACSVVAPTIEQGQRSSFWIKTTLLEEM